MQPQKVLVVVGTRPDALKMAPVIHRLRAEPDAFTPVVCATAQHRELLDSALSIFHIKPDIEPERSREVERRDSATGEKSGDGTR